MKSIKLCYCNKNEPYTSCCQPLHEGTFAPTAEALMRSRYSAYVLGLEQYLLDTWHPDTRPSSLSLKEETTMKWLGLDIKRVENTNKATGNKTAVVEFVARYRVGGGKAERLHEVSEFERLDRWYYKTGTILD